MTEAVRIQRHICRRVASKLVQPCFQEEFAALHAKYMEVKSQRIQDVEEAITEIRAQEQVRSKKAMQVLSSPPAVLCAVHLDTRQLAAICKRMPNCSGTHSLVISGLLLVWSEWH